MKILVVQLGRPADILMSLPAIQALKNQNKDSFIELVVRETFKDVAELSRSVDKVTAFPTYFFLEPVIKTTSSSKVIAFNRLHSWIEKYFSHTYDLLLNFTFSDASAYFSGLIQANEKKGMYYRKASLNIEDSWSRYVVAQVLESDLNLLHFSDIFSRIAGNPDSENWPINLKFEHCKSNDSEFSKGKKVIGIRKKGSHTDVTFTEKSWELAEQALKRVWSDAFILNLDNAASYSELIHLVNQCSLVVTVDFDTLHLACAFGVQSILLNIGDYSADNVGPYRLSKNNEPHHVVFVNDSSAHLVSDALFEIIQTGKTKQRIRHAHTKLVKCNFGKYRSELVPKNYLVQESRNFFIKAYYLLAEFQNSGSIEDIEIPTFGKQKNSNALDGLEAAFEGLCTLRRVAEYGRNYSIEMLSLISNNAQKDTLAEKAKKLKEVEDLCEKLKKSVPFMQPLMNTWRVNRELSLVNADEMELKALIELSEGCFRELAQSAEVLIQLLETAVQAAQKEQNQQVCDSKRLKLRELEL